MKRIVTLLLAAGLVFGAAGVSQAVDIKAKGVFDLNFESADRSFLKNNNNDDHFNVKERFRSQIDIIASESLKGVVFFEIGDVNWGQQTTGGALGTDAIAVEVRYAYVDFVVPGTDLMLRAGLQPLTLPNFVAGSQVLNHDGAGLAAILPINENVSVTALWARAENDNFGGRAMGTGLPNQDHRFKSDSLDVFGLIVPLTFDGVKVTPWAAYAMAGRNSLSQSAGGTQLNRLQYGLLPTLPADLGMATGLISDSHGNAWWLGLTGEITLASPFRFAWDANYGRVDLGTAKTTFAGLPRDMDVKREGYIISALVEYKMDMMTPGLIFWYGSGDDSNPWDGSERMPTMRPSWNATSYGFDGAFGLNGNSNMIGEDNAGTWGVIAQLKDISFMEDLSHTLRVGYYRGTNDKAMANGQADWGVGGPSLANGKWLYLTEEDDVWEVNFDTRYNIYENLTLCVELGYLHLNLDEGVWGQATVDAYEENNFKGGVNIQYRF